VKKKEMVEKIGEMENFIKEIAEIVGIDTDVVGYDGIHLTIDDFREAVKGRRQTTVEALSFLREKIAILGEDIKKAVHFKKSKRGKNE